VWGDFTSPHTFINHMKRILHSSSLTWWLLGVLAAGLFTVYFSILPDHLVTMSNAGDGGDFLAAMLTHGIPHPTGYPTYMLLGQVFLFIPWSTPYFKVALLSAIATACAAGLLFLWVSRELTDDRKSGLWIGAAAALAWGTAPLVFSQAVIVEVYGLQSLLILCNLWWITFLIKGVKTQKDRSLVSLLAFAVGLSLGNHITILFLMPAWIYALLSAYRNGNSVRFLSLQIALPLAGCLVYLYLPLSARNFPPINWGNPQILSGFWWEISGRAYQASLFTIPFGEFISRIAAFARLLLDQFGILGLIIGLIGAVMMEGLKRSMVWLCIWIFTAYSIFSLGYTTNDSFLYLIPTYIVFSIWIGSGLLYLARWRLYSIPFGILAGGLLIVFLLVRIPFTRASLDARKDIQAVSYAEKYLKIAPQGAILLTDSSEDTFPLWYYHFGLGVRPDLHIILLPLTQFVWYQKTIHNVYPDLLVPLYAESPYTDWGESIPALNPALQVCRSQPDASAEYGIQFSCSDAGK
jgi:hypothetical protein